MTEGAHRIAADNRRARFEYFIDETLEVGIMLRGTEVKALRLGRANIADSYAAEQGGEIYLIIAYIPEYHGGNRFNHEPRAPRKLLLHRREIGRLIGLSQRGGATLVPLSIYFNAQGRAKVALAVARGKKLHDKRATIKARDWQREKGRLLRHGG